MSATSKDKQDPEKSDTGLEVKECKKPDCKLIKSSDAKSIESASRISSDIKNTDQKIPPKSKSNDEALQNAAGQTVVEEVAERKKEDSAQESITETSQKTQPRPKQTHPKEIKKQTAKVSKEKKGSQHKKTRVVKDQEITSKKQSTLTQHFQVRRSERKLKSIEKEDYRLSLEKKILSGDESDLEIRLIEEKGRGVFSKKKLEKGDLVCEYAGDLIEDKEAKRREEEYEKNPKLGCYMYYFQYKNKKYCVDATKESGRLGRLLNHSKTCNNVETKLFPIDDTPYLILIASRDILPEEELLYDYGDRSKAAVESHPWLKA